MAVVLFYSLLCLPLLLALELLPLIGSPWSWYAITIMLIGFPYIDSIMGKFHELPHRGQCSRLTNGL
ncbi:hypothetical protein BKA67DRAFT_563252 [Truncatella angustata]|uniref:Uncharacterized protein n=1 Tax=Truncatella angustata TaxID=152316 RepID=A0A9P8ZWK6_9PEZI|nr:uncharacterized protein BKA67DRAFT_563252 [Truncatella angustata]KAH6653822.1 hypothetical protein BKA67DRAFT_563252 [Truncatella angustata]